MLECIKLDRLNENNFQIYLADNLGRQQSSIFELVNILVLDKYKAACLKHVGTL